MFRRIFLLLLLASQTLSAQDLSQYEKILLPAFSVEPTLGLGVLFSTQLYAVSELDFRYFPAPGAGRPEFRVQPAFDPFVSFYAVPRATRGLLMFVDRTVASHVAFAYELRVNSHLTPLPVVREDQFLRGPSRIVGVTSRTSSLDFVIDRSHLRIYDVDNSGTLRVRVRVKAIWPSPGRVLDERIVDVNGRDGTEIVHPYYSEILLPACVPDPPRICGDGRLSVELEPLADVRYYAFASSTDNFTQEVRVFTPDRAVPRPR